MIQGPTIMKPIVNHHIDYQKSKGTSASCDIAFKMRIRNGRNRRQQCASPIANGRHRNESGEHPPTLVLIKENIDEVFLIRMLTIVQHVVIGIVKMLVELHLTSKGSIYNAAQHRI